jgi:L-threonylcarbamoyladenylate synthase
MYDTWIPEDIEKAVDTIKSGGLILYPTDTIWGIGCNATNPEAIAAVFQLKKRSRDKPLVILVNSIEMMKVYARRVHPRVETLLEFHDKPLTVIYPSSEGLPEALTGENGSIAIRIVKDAFCDQLIEKSGCPLVSTSANQTDQPYPNTFGEVSSNIIEGVSYVCKYRQGSRAFQPPSVIATFDGKGALEFIRN